MNRYYDYASLSRWDSSAWDDRHAAADYLMDAIVPLAYEDNRRDCVHPDRFAGRTDGCFDPKMNACTYADELQKWAELGLLYHCTSMGSVAWIAMVPMTVLREKEESLRILVVPHSADLGDRNWAMNTLEDLATTYKTAASESCVVLTVVFRAPRSSGIYMDILLELSAIFHLSLDRLYLDLTHLERNGLTLSDVKGLDRNALGTEVRIGQIPAVSISGQWIAQIGHQFICKQINLKKEGFDAERFMHSTVGHCIADSLWMEHELSAPEDPRLLAHWEQMGLVCDFHRHASSGERYIVFAPRQSLEDKEKLPILLILKEVRELAPFLTLTAFQFYHEFFEIAANGECMLLFFAMETPDDNDLLIDVLLEASERYPIDLERVYLAGQSHNGYFALEFARRHPGLLAGLAQFNDRFQINAPQVSMDNVKMTDEMILDLAAQDLPMIDICGQAENEMAREPVHTDTFQHNADGFNRRLRASRCREYSREEILAARQSKNKAERCNGIPAPHSETRYCMGSELYISEYFNIDGNWHLTLASVENLPHLISPQMAELSWSFLRRFRRDRTSGRIVE